ncbi:MAG TPA: carboxypeptidase-like regulatory domain-containing protein [Alphaproteobacteria bacterium]|nr:carboxypeptidase-like regulatory domain-containing protein [Alphaproteobacteria bacterium]
MKKSIVSPLIAASVLLLFVIASCRPLAAAGPTAVQHQLRSLSGRVYGSHDEALSKAIVYLKNTKTLGLKTYISDDDGSYRFPALSPNVDYEVYAEYKGVRSSTKTLSAFDSRRDPTINLKIHTN